MYSQGIATMALAEAYGITGDPKLREPLERAVRFIIDAQNESHGGWRYRPGSNDGDTSVFGWQVMALASARLAGLDVPDEVYDRSAKWLDRVGGGKNQGLYGYQNRNPSPAMVAEGMFSQQLLGLGPDNPRMIESANYIAQHPPSMGKSEHYYWYYACLSLYQHQGPVWEQWNEKMRPIFIDTQIRSGEHAGSWKPDGRWSREGGRVMSTAMATLSLEVYYRYLPLYNFADRGE